MEFQRNAVYSMVKKCIEIIFATVITYNRQRYIYIFIPVSFLLLRYLPLKQMHRFRQYVQHFPSTESVHISMVCFSK